MLKLLAILALASVGMAAQTTPHNAQEKRIAEHSARSESSQQPKAKSNSTNAPSPVTVNVQTSSPADEHESATEQENIDIQRKLKTFTGLLVIVGFLQVGTMFWQAWLLRDTRVEISRQAKIANQAMIAQFRPKIRVRFLKYEIEDAETMEEVKPRVSLSLVNVGDTSALIKPWKFVFMRRHILERDRVLPGDFHEIAMAELKVEKGASKDIEILLPNAVRHLMAEVGNRRRRDEGRGAATYPICIGVIVYLDENGCERRTAFHRTWNDEAAIFVKSENPENEYED